MVYQNAVTKCTIFLYNHAHKIVNLPALMNRSTHHKQELIPFYSKAPESELFFFSRQGFSCVGLAALELHLDQAGLKLLLSAGIEDTCHQHPTLSNFLKPNYKKSDLWEGGCLSGERCLMPSLIMTWIQSFGPHGRSQGQIPEVDKSLFLKNYLGWPRWNRLELPAIESGVRIQG